LDEIRSLATNPFPEGSRKLVGGEFTYRIRVGDYRVTYQIYRQREVIEIDRIRHRKDVYRD
jgi:mRNA interferase RelE/StbE